MDEYVDVLDEHGNYTGEVVLKSEAHSKGLFHPTVHVWFYTVNSELLLQKRSVTKKTFPGLWDVSVAGHIDTGEDILDSAKREVMEELGVNLENQELVKIGVHKSQQKHSENLIDCEFHHIFISELKTPLKDLKLQESEVSDVKLISVNDFERVLGERYLQKDYVVLDSSYYDLVLSSIKKMLS